MVTPVYTCCFIRSIRKRGEYNLSLDRRRVGEDNRGRRRGKRVDVVHMHTGLFQLEVGAQRLRQKLCVKTAGISELGLEEK